MPKEELAAVIALTSATLIGFVFLLRFMRAFLLHRTLRKAIEAQLPGTGALIERMSDPGGPGGAGNDDRSGMILIALALGLVGFTLIAIGDWPTQRILLGGSLFPLLVGAVLLWRHRKLTGAKLIDARDDVGGQ
jgi:hypothetical protein